MCVMLIPATERVMELLFHWINSLLWVAALQCCVNIIISSSLCVSVSGIFFGSWWQCCWWRMCGMKHTHGLCWSSCFRVAFIHWPPAVPTLSAACPLVPVISATSLTTERSAFTALVRHIPFRTISYRKGCHEDRVQGSKFWAAVCNRHNGILTQLMQIVVKLHHHKLYTSQCCILFLGSL